MTRTLRSSLLLVLLPLALATAACGSEKAEPGASGGGSATRTGGSADRAELEARARYMQSAIELIQVIEADGFEVAPQSAGVVGDDGFGSVYVSARDGARIRLTVDRSTLNAANCPDNPVEEASGPVQCERDGDAWYRTSGSAHEYARAEDGHVVRVGADRATVDRDTLRRAAASARPADDRELDALLPEQTAPTAPVERGDLPPVGDGAPDNSVPEGASG
ncbi:hypothetical protein [Streptomyces scopuliridis]|uniref:Membrane lipoprotein n=1 Tax=Streptomyces scopuliridis RB72 TaxID=1440053 RepID=A0A2T7TCV0_9ACTN|nr:hypothetical protein [Streptomyces scopuliridis]PVE12921.1 hypothetical protein Y717_25330 [Streptomyces scopuliridis RB72]